MRITFVLMMSLFSVFLNQTQAQENINSLERYWKPNMEKVRIISYNIFNGFDWRKDLERQDRFIDWVKYRNPEVLAMQELCGFTEESLTELAKEWGHPYAVIVKEGGYPVGLTSKEPIIVKNKIVENVGHGLLHVQTYGFDFLVTHLNPFEEKKRLDEAQFILDYIEDKGLDNFLLMGDMNSHSPMDADYMEENSTKLIANGRFDYSVISRFLSYSLVDVCREYVGPDKRFTFPTSILKNVSKHKDVRLKAAQRIDYIFMPPNILDKVVDAFILNEGEPEYLSDHFPIGVDLFIKTDDK